LIIAFHKPYGVLSQFTPDQPGQRTLSEFNFPQNVYSLGRLDLDSEGLLLLSDEKKWNDLLLNPAHAHERTYHVQVDGAVTMIALQKLEKGVLIQGYQTLPCRASQLHSLPQYSERNPPIRFRKNIPTSWIELELVEGKNRQVRRMTAAVGFPTLRLIRVAIKNVRLGDLAVGEWREISAKELL
jgi:23S rRNA pseudouridine2457 synthase